MIWLLMMLALAQQDDAIVSENLDTSTASIDFERAMAKYNSIERDESKPMFDEIVSHLQSKSELSDEERFILRESLKFLGVITYPSGTASYFRRLVEIDPGYDMGSQKLSPKIVKIFDDLRAEMVGQVRIAISEAAQTGGALLSNATVSVDGKTVGLLQGATTFDVMTGVHEIDVAKPNFDSFNTQVTVTPGKLQTVNGVMVRNASELVFLTVPSNVKVFMEGVEQGTTQGTAPIDLADQLTGSGIAPSQASDLFSINDVSAGRYMLRFERPCYKTKRFEIEVTSNERTVYKPVIMEPVYSYIDVETASGGAAGIVYLDDERIGSLPIRAHQTCPGEFTLKVQFTDGQFIKHIVLDEGQSIRVVAEPLPSIVWFGVKEEEGQAPENDVDRWLREMKSWNVSLVNPNNTRLVQQDPFDLFFAESGRVTAAAQSLDRSLNADLYVAARVVRKKVVIRFLEVAFWTPLSQEVRVYSIDFRELDRFKAILDQIDAPLPLTHSWIGARTAKVIGQNGCEVLEVSPHGPLASIATPGDLITSANGKLLSHPSQLLDLPAGEPVNLEINGTTTTVTPIACIAELPFDPAIYCPQAVVARLDKMGKYASSEIIGESALFNQARYQFFIGDYQQAFDTFSTFRLDHSYGINQGTLYFYQGLCFRRLNLAAEANDAFRQVLNYDEATLFDAYGPKVAFWAEAQLQDGN